LPSPSVQSTDDLSSSDNESQTEEHRSLAIRTTTKAIVAKAPFRRSKIAAIDERNTHQNTSESKKISRRVVE